MFTKDQLLSDIKKFGILPTDLLTVHSSLKSVGGIVHDADSSEAEVLLKALREAVKDGLLIIPSHTYTNINSLRVFDVRHTKPCIGGVPCCAVELANKAWNNGDKTIQRSLHPDHSVVAFGNRAEEYIKDDRRTVTPMPMFASYGKLLTENGKILLLGTDLSHNTFDHMVDEYIEPTGLRAPYQVKVIDYTGNAEIRTTRNCQGFSRTYGGYEPFLREAGALTYGKIGNADSILVDTKLCFEIVKKYRTIVTGHQHYPF